ncbi:uncharacterized protein CC84DRAFT_1174861 [Paraphaeosphaeria sporulosa]|uniref:Uncharacterized protein n=1 Tax=Paraphaeosphaeria sporulosa TaxID=1460663 RepID=A0A177CJF5_9PLEO|nr:uncharacterized protein CC84DRAFT_1174861 [Paraphaeosphaeria sporulosa]OAG06969.1 hypothetical protein CC84DRAFT_1174861 [Paraphaeosphaeria sporulosa]
MHPVLPPLRNPLHAPLPNLNRETVCEVSNDGLRRRNREALGELPELLAEVPDATATSYRDLDEAHEAAKAIVKDYRYQLQVIVGDDGHAEPETETREIVANDASELIVARDGGYLYEVVYIGVEGSRESGVQTGFLDVGAWKSFVSGTGGRRSRVVYIK